MEANRAKQTHISRGGSRSIANLVFQMDNLIAHKKTPSDKLEYEGTTITADMEHKLEDEAIKSVRGKKKTIQSGWHVGVGPVLMKKDHWMKSIASSSHGVDRSSDTDEILKNQVRTLKEQLKESNEKCVRMSDFLLTKFPILRT